MPILSRYLLRQFLPAFAVCLGLFIGVLLMQQFIKLFNMAVMKGISIFWIASCFARLLPYFLSLAVPMAFIVAMMLTLGALSESGEVLALRACGFSFFDMTWPFLALAMALSGLLFYVNHKAAPDGFHAFRQQYLQAAGQIARVDLQPGSFMRLGPWKLYARKADSDTGRLEGVYLIRSDGSGGVRVSAQNGAIRFVDQAVSLELFDGQLQLPDRDPQKLTLGGFGSYRVRVPLASAVSKDRHLDIPELSTAKLRQRIKDEKTDASRRLEYAVEMAVRSAAALSPFVFFWVAAPLGISFGKNSRGYGFAASLGVLLVFYGLLAGGIGAGRRYASLSSLAPWAADVVVLAVGLALSRRAVKR